MRVSVASGRPRRFGSGRARTWHRAACKARLRRGGHGWGEERGRMVHPRMDLTSHVCAVSDSLRDSRALCCAARVSCLRLCVDTRARVARNVCVRVMRVCVCVCVGPRSFALFGPTYGPVGRHSAGAGGCEQRISRLDFYEDTQVERIGVDLELCPRRARACPKAQPTAPQRHTPSFATPCHMHASSRLSSVCACVCNTTHTVNCKHF